MFVLYLCPQDGDSHDLYQDLKFTVLSLKKLRRTRFTRIIYSFMFFKVTDIIMLVLI